MKTGQKLEFNTYGFTIKGTFIKTDGDKIVIRTTHDFLGKEMIGKEQSIHKDHLI